MTPPQSERKSGIRKRTDLERDWSGARERIESVPTIPVPLDLANDILDTMIADFWQIDSEWGRGTAALTEDETIVALAELLGRELR